MQKLETNKDNSLRLMMEADIKMMAEEEEE